MQDFLLVVHSNHVPMLHHFLDFVQKATETETNLTAVTAEH